MTTIACNRHEMAGDSCLTHQDIGIGTGQFPTKKLHRIGKSIFGERGEDMSGVGLMLDWLRKGAKRKDAEMRKFCEPRGGCALVPAPLWEQIKRTLGLEGV